MCRKLEVLPCYVSDRLLGVPLERVVKVVRAAWITPLPEAPPGIAGVVDVRGKVVPVVDVRMRLGIEPRPLELSDVFVLANSAAGQVALWVDRTGGAASLATDADGPVSNDPSQAGFVEAICHMGGELLLVLTLDRLVAAIPSPDPLHPQPDGHDVA